MANQRKYWCGQQFFCCHSWIFTMWLNYEIGRDRKSQCLFNRVCLFHYFSVKHRAHYRLKGTMLYMESTKPPITVCNRWRKMWWVCFIENLFFLRNINEKWTNWKWLENAGYFNTSAKMATGRCGIQWYLLFGARYKAKWAETHFERCQRFVSIGRINSYYGTIWCWQIHIDEYFSRL